jgi:hypothetical protein
MYPVINARWPLRRVSCTCRLALGIAVVILVGTSPSYGQTTNEQLPVIIEITGSADEYHWPVFIRRHSTPFAETQPIIGSEVEWRVDENGHLPSTTNAHLQSSGDGNDGTLNSVMEVHHNYGYVECAICPATGVSVTATTKFWVPGPPGTPIWIGRNASGAMVDMSTNEENAFVQANTIKPNVFREVMTSYREGGPTDLGLNRTSRTSLSGQNVPPNSLHEGVWSALTSTPTMVFDGVEYSSGLTLMSLQR